MPAIGDNFLRYKIISLIGSGGMGEVYLAKDRQLERKVAIKILRQKYHKNEDGLQRFIMEARSASALNHPNIITIYDIGEADGSHYIASEFIDGKTLHQLIDRGPLPINEILSIAVQIAEALTAAHAAGIVHRDIKPENIMIRGDGYIKVLDFGLAKLTEYAPQSADGDDDTKRLVTNPGIVMGTVSYMSPEQARGRRLDGRSDVWSLGVVLYEMITGYRPFPGDTTSDMIAAILKSEPPPISTYAPEAPNELERIVNKSLRKDRDERYQHIKDLLIDLKDLKHEIDVRSRSETHLISTNSRKYAESTGDAAPGLTTGAVRSTTGSISEIFLTQFKLHPVLVPAIIVFALAAIGAAGWGIRKYGGQPTAGSFQSMRFAKLTTSGQAVGGQVAISADGKYLAYAAQDVGQQSLWVQQTATHGSVQIIPPANVDYKGITFGPDSNYIFYVAESSKEQPGIYKVPVLGGETRKIISDGGGPVTFSPAGDRFVFVRDEKSIIITDNDGKSLHELATAPTGDVWMFPTWSPDGSTIACASYSQSDSSFHVVEVTVSDGKETGFHSPVWYWINGMAWLPDGSAMVVSARDLDTELSQLWSISVPDGEATRLSNDLSSFQGFSLTADGTSAVSVQESRTVNIWRSEDDNPDTLRKLTTEVSQDEGLSGIAWVPDGRILYTIRIKGRQDIRIVHHDGSNGHQLTSDSKSNFWPVASPDNRFIVFISTRTGNVDLWRMNIDGTDAVQLTSDPEIESLPSISPDGKWLAYQRTDGNNKTTIWKMNVDGTDREQIVDNESRQPTFSPDGKSILFKYAPDGTGDISRLGLIATDGGKEIQQLDFPPVVSSRFFQWSSDGKAIIYLEGQTTADRLWIQPVKGGEPKEFFNTKGLRIFGFDISPADNELALALGDDRSDVVMVNNFR